MNFQFRLESVLRHRQKREEALQKELSQLQAHATREEACLLQIETDLQQQYEERRMAQRAQMNVELLNFLENHCERLRRERKKQQQRVQQAHQAVEGKRRELVQASQEREVLARLRERQRAEFMEEWARREQNFLDELATQRHRSVKV
jgi:flagellar FliJ protein